MTADLLLRVADYNLVNSSGRVEPIRYGHEMLMDIACFQGFSLQCLKTRKTTLIYCPIALGHGDNEHRNSPTKIEALSEVSMIAAGARHSLAALEDGRVYSFGVGSNGRLGHGDQTSQNTPTLIEALPQCDVLGLAAGYHHSLVLVSEYPIIINLGDMPIQTTVPPVIRNVNTDGSSALSY